MIGLLWSKIVSKNATPALADPIIYRASDNQEAQRRVTNGSVATGSRNGLTAEIAATMVASTKLPPHGCIHAQVSHDAQKLREPL